MRSRALARGARADRAWYGRDVARTTSTAAVALVLVGGLARTLTRRQTRAQRDDLTDPDAARHVPPADAASAEPTTGRPPESTP